MPHRITAGHAPSGRRRLAVRTVLTEHIKWSSVFPALAGRTSLTRNRDHGRFHKKSSGSRDEIIAKKKSRKMSRRKRKLFTALLVILLLSLIAYIGYRDEGSPDQVGTPSKRAFDPTEIQAPAVQAPATVTPSPTQVATAGELFLQLIEPAEFEVITDAGSIKVAGRTRVDAVVTINDTMVEPNIDGEFSLDMELEEGPNIIEVVASVVSGAQMDLVLVAIYVP